MEDSYVRILAYRNSARATCASVVACPAAQATLTAALTVEAAIQNLIQSYWNEQAEVWNTELKNRCDLGNFAKANDFPKFPYPIVDSSLGLNGNEELTVLFQPISDLSLRIEERKLASSATASRDAPSEWNVRWSE